MNVIGFSRWIACGPIKPFPVKPKNFDSADNGLDIWFMSASNSQNPALCRVSAYSGPGFPSPMMSLYVLTLRLQTHLLLRRQLLVQDQPMRPSACEC